MSAAERTHSNLADISERLLSGRRELRVLSAMGPGQSESILRDLIGAARASGTTLTIYFADLTARAAFLDETCKADIADGRLRLVAIAGAIAKGWDGYVDTFPNSLWDLDWLIGAGALPFDAVILRAWPTDNPKVFSYGDMIGYSASAIARDAILAVELMGQDAAACPPASTGLPAERIDLCLQGAAEARPVSEAQADAGPVGSFVVDLLPDGATLQFGLGSIADAVVAGLAGRGVYRVRSGVVTPQLSALRATATLVDEPVEATGIVGARCPDARLGPGDILLRPTSETHDPRRLATINRFWAINSAIEVDLDGNVNAEFIAGRRVALGGGQGDFVRAAHLSAGGASVIALPARTGRLTSRIVARLDRSNPPTTPAQDVDFIATDHGAVCLRGLTRKERQRAILEIAHPEDRDELARAAGL